jgi:hypothetical protein
MSWGTLTADVVGPSSATDNAVARFDSTTGKLLQNSSVTISDTGDIDIPNDYLNLSVLSSDDDFIYRSYPAYKIGLYHRPYTIIANTMISYVTFPKHLFYNFLQELTSPEGKLKQYIEDQNKHNQESTRPKPYSRIPYGIDEYFMNMVVYDYIIQSLMKTRVLLDYRHVFVDLRHLKLISDDEDAMYYTYSLYPNSSLFDKLKKIYMEKAPLIEDKYPGIITSFTDSFIKVYRKKGTELLSL